MAEDQRQKQSQDIRALEENPHISTVGGDRVRIEFQIDDLVSQLTRQIPNRIVVASCGGCNGCSATA